jgi:hypothetical protein
MAGALASTISGVTGPHPSSAGGPGPRRSLLVRGGHVITMDPVLGDIPGGDVLVSGGEIVAAGHGAAVPPGTEVLDATGMMTEVRHGAHEALGGVLVRGARSVTR